MRLSALVLSLIVLAVPAAAQVSETPVPFDTAGRILSVNPPLATRLGLTAPAWPVTGLFVEARLYQLNTGSHVLAVTRSGGSVDRFALDSSQTGALRAAFQEGLSRAGRVVAEDAASVISEPARGPFVRDQMLLASILYGPSLAILTDDGAVGSGLYMLSVGGTFFAVNDFARKRSITKAQNSLTTDGALRGWAAVNLAAAALHANYSDETGAILTLTGGIGGSMIGYHRGRGLTNSEAQSAMTMSTLAAAAAVGAFATLVEPDDDGRAIATAALAGGIAGYIAGPSYPRRASYTVTAGDVSLLRLGAGLGAMAAITPVVHLDNVDPHVAAGLLTAGWVTGALVTDRIAAKPFNHSAFDARMIGLGALGGGLMGAALPLMMQSDDATFAMTVVTGGAIAGAMVTQRMMAPAREGSVMKSSSASANSGARIQFQPEAALLAAAGQRGNHTLLRVRF